MDVRLLWRRLSYDSQCQLINYNIDINAQRPHPPGVCFGHHLSFAWPLGHSREHGSKAQAPEGNIRRTVLNLPNLSSLAEKIMATLALVSKFSPSLRFSLVSFSSSAVLAAGKRVRTDQRRCPFWKLLPHFS